MSLRRAARVNCIPMWEYVKSVDRFLRTLLFGVGAIDGLTMAVVVALMSVVVVAATYLPASRAAGVDPMLAIRHD